MGEQGGIPLADRAPHVRLLHPSTHIEEGIAPAHGALDIVLVCSEHPPVLFEQVESVTDKQGMRIPRFVCVDAFPPFEPQLRYGINVFDLNNDGLEEILLGAAGGGPATLLTHTGDRYVRQGPGVAFADGHVRSTAGDLDGDGRLDLVVALSFQPHVFRNLTPDTRPPIRVRVLGQGGALNHQGRVVRLRPEADSTFVVTRVVDSGSGYMSQRDYEPKTMRECGSLRKSSEPSVISSI